MEEKLLKIFKLAIKLDAQQNKIYAEIEYSAHNSQKLEISIRSKKDFSYIEKYEIYLGNTTNEKMNEMVTLFETFVGGVLHE